jgi:DNA-binding MarR family transcriptional regulator
MSGKAVSVETKVITALRRLIRATDLDAKQIAQKTGLTVSQLLVLELLADRGELTVGAIAERVGLTQGTVTTMTERLQGRGLVNRRRAATDRRQVKINLSNDGAELLKNAPMRLQTRFLGEFHELPQWEKYAILSALMRLADLMGVKDLDAAPVLDVGSIDKAPNT